MALERNITQLKPGDIVYARRVDAPKDDFDIQILTVHSVHLQDATGIWINRIADVDWGSRGIETGTYKYKKGYIVIDDLFPKSPHTCIEQGKYVCIPIDEHSEYKSGVRIFTTDGIEIDVYMDKNVFLNEFRKTLESIHIDAIRTQKSYERLEKELKKYE